MDNFLKRKSTMLPSPSVQEQKPDPGHSYSINKELEQLPLLPYKENDRLKQSRVEVNLKDLPSDPGLRPKINDYHPNDRDQVRRYYLQKSLCQPREYKFPQRLFGQGYRRFNPAWFNEFGDWLEYSVTKDAAYCFYCYLFRPDIGKQAGGDVFVSEGFCNWKKKERIQAHVGGPDSAHNRARQKCENLMNEMQLIEVALSKQSDQVLSKQSDQVQTDYRTLLTASVDCIRFLLRQGLAFRDHHEIEDSENQGNFLELLRLLAHYNEDVNNVVMKNAPENLQLMAPEIEKDIVNAAANETTSVIISDLGDEFFAILIHESHDLCFKEQMVVSLRYVDKKGRVIERFLGIIHVSDTTAVSLKVALESLFSKHGLSMSRLRGQSYDGASDIQGEFNGLKSLIMRENESAYYVHCFAHPLQLTLVAIAKYHIPIAQFFNSVTNLINVVGASCKRRESEVVKLAEALRTSEGIGGHGLNQETSQQSGHTCWGSHYGTLINLIILFPSVGDVLEIIVDDGLNSKERAEAYILLDSIYCFDFAFNLHLMKSILGITNALSQALQRKDQDIINAMALVKVSKRQLQMLRDEGWEPLFSEVSSFCTKHSIDIPNMDDMFAIQGQSLRRVVQQMTNLHHYQVELFYSVIDMQLQELNTRFTEVSTELVLCVASLNPSDSFSAFDKCKLIRLAQFYASDFSLVEIMMLDNQLETYIIDMRSSIEFSELRGIGDLAKKLVEWKKDIVYPFVYTLVKLALTLPVAAATVERAFSAMNIVKSHLRNGMGDQWMNDCLVTYIESEIFDTIDNERIIQRLQNMKND